MASQANFFPLQYKQRTNVVPLDSTFISSEQHQGMQTGPGTFCTGGNDCE